MSSGPQHHHYHPHHQQQELEKNAQEFLYKMWRGDGGRTSDGRGNPNSSSSRPLKIEGGEEPPIASKSSGQESDDLLVSKWLVDMAGTTGKQAINHTPLGIDTTRPGTPAKTASKKHPHKVGFQDYFCLFPFSMRFLLLLS